MPEAPPPGSGPRLREAMPRPVLIVFVLVCVAALVGAIVLVVNPPGRSDVALFDRRPPPTATADNAPSHDTGEVAEVLPPRTQVPLEPPCPEVRGVRAIAGPAGVRRITTMLTHACRLAAGTSPELAAAVRNLGRSVTIRFASFDKSGVESTYQRLPGRLYLNVRFASTEIPAQHVVPIILHEAAHWSRVRCPPPLGSRMLCVVARGTSPEQELAARTVEVEACRHLIPAPEWPRWCRDAREITAMPRDAALRALRAAGYA